MGLYSVSGETVAALKPGTFSERRQERDIQVWSDRNPALINDGKPMLSLGMELVTKYGLLDGNGTPVAAEMKRGRTPRDVVAQLIDYASFIAGLDWQAVEPHCQKARGRSTTGSTRKLSYNLDDDPEGAEGREGVSSSRSFASVGSLLLSPSDGRHDRLNGGPGIG